MGDCSPGRVAGAGDMATGFKARFSRKLDCNTEFETGSGALILVLYRRVLVMMDCFCEVARSLANVILLA